MFLPEKKEHPKNLFKLIILNIREFIIINVIWNSLIDINYFYLWWLNKKLSVGFRELWRSTLEVSQFDNGKKGIDKWISTQFGIGCNLRNIYIYGQSVKAFSRFSSQAWKDHAAMVWLRQNVYPKSLKLIFLNINYYIYKKEW